MADEPQPIDREALKAELHRRIREAVGDMSWMPQPASMTWGSTDEVVVSYHGDDAFTLSVRITGAGLNG